MDSGHPCAIEDYAIIGDCRSAALVSREGSIDWLCWPRFDSPPIFGAILDPKAGRFRIAPAQPSCSERSYLPHTNVLQTRFEALDGVLVLTDLMAVAGEDEKRGRLTPEHELLRLVSCEQGQVEVEVELDPRPRYGGQPGRWREAGKLGMRYERGATLLALQAECPVQLDASGAAFARFRLQAGETVRFSLVHATEAPAALSPLGAFADAALERSVRFWRSWADRAGYQGPHRELVIRSALTLKLLAFAPSGAILAAPTTSLPERVGGELNWDYRYCWLRDASFTARALLGLGYQDEAEAFVNWLLHTTRIGRPAVHVLYDIYGRGPPRERTVSELAGYQGSRPVREGNQARDQLQLDVYGEVVDAAAQYVRSGGALDRETGRMLASLGHYVCQHWQEPDEGIWEPRSGRTHHTFSKVLCWAALDRLLELHSKGHIRGADADRFAETRGRIRSEIEARGFRADLGSYTQQYGGEQVDASLLLLPWYGYTPAGSARMAGTWRRIEAQLSAGRGLLYRYPESRQVGEGAFGICGFWAVEYLSLGGNSLQAALGLFERQLSFANDVGLYAEEIDPQTGTALGNFPQAFTHVGLINAALSLQARMEGREQLPHHRGVQPAEELPAEASL
jgi:GH15 family glucan-1,4-alpha-glucosidase